MGGTTRIWDSIGNVTSSITGLIQALRNTNDVNVGHIGAIADELKKFNDPAIARNTFTLNTTLGNLTNTLTQLNQSSSMVHHTMRDLVEGFNSASNGFYSVRSSIEAIATDFTDSLKPVRNSDLFDTLERFKHLNDSYKNVGGLGQGLGSLISALDMLGGRNLQTHGIKQLLDYFELLANDPSIDKATAQMEKVGSMAQPIASLVNALKYTDFDDKNNVLTVLGKQINEFYQSLPQDFSKLSFVFNGLKKLIELASDAEAFGVKIPEDNVISQLGKSLEGFKGFDDIKKLESFVRNITQLVGDMIRFTNDLNAHKGRDLADAFDVSPILKVGEALKSLTDLESRLNAFTKFTASLQGLNKIGKFNLNGLDEKLAKLFDSLHHLPEGRVESLKDLGSVTRALARLQDADPNKLSLIADALAKIIESLGHIQGSNNKINIRLDSEGVANFQRTVENTSRTWDDFSERLKHDLGEIDISQMFDLNAPLNGLQRQLREAERMLRQRMKQMNDEYAKMQQSVQTKANYQDSPVFQTQVSKFTRARREAEQLRDVIMRLNEAIASMPRFSNDREAYQHIHSLQEEYSRLEETVNRITQNGSVEVDPSSRESRVLQILQDRMDTINEELQNAFAILGDMEDTEEGIAYRASEIADAWNRIADEAERASQEMRNSISEGFGGFSSMLKSSKNGVLGSIGNAFDIFGKGIKSGSITLGESQLASLEGLAGTLGKVATAVSYVGAVVGVVVSAFKAWWDLMEKIKSALIRFVQSCIQFAKNMLTTVVGAFNAVAGAVSKVVSAVRSGAEVVVSALRKIKDFASGVISFFGKVGTAVAPVVKGIKAVMSAVTPKFVKTLASSNFQLSKLIKNTHLLKNAVKGVQRYFSMLTRMLMRKSITAFLNQMKQAFEDMVLFEKQADDSMLQLNYNVSIVLSEFRRVANQVMAIFEPLINAMAVPMQMFLANISAMAENMAKFMAILTGQPYYLRAKRFYEDYGDNVDKTRQKVKNLTNGLDELNILNNKSSDDEGGINLEDMFEKVDVDNFNFGLPALGEIVDKIVEFLQNIDWEKIWEKIREIIHRVMEYINYILSRLDLWEWLGKTLGDLINTLMVAWNQFITDFDPKLLADAISTFIVNALREIDWELINENIELTARKFAEFWNEIFGNQELWDEIATAITNLLNEITHYFDTWAWTFDFSQMAQTLTDAIARIFQGFDWEQLRHAVEGWVSGIVNFINTAIANKEFWTTLGQTVKNIINNVLIEALVNLAKIDLTGLSDSLKVAIQNALDGIRWEDFANSLSTIATDLANAINNFFGDEEFLTQITTAIANFANAIIGAISDFITTLNGYDIGSAIGTALKNGLGNVDWDTIFKLPADAINLLSDALRGLLDSIPEDFNLGTWLTSHLKITLDGIKWDEIEKNIGDLAKQISNFINGVLSDEEFWAKFGQATGKVIKIGLNFIFEIFNVNGEDLGTAIANYINGLVGEFNIGNVIRKTVDVALNLIVALDVALRGIDWETIGDQITQGIIDAIDRIYENRGLIVQTIEDAFAVFNAFIYKLINRMIQAGSFRKLGETAGTVLLALIEGVADFFTMNTDSIIVGMKQLSDSLASFIEENEDRIVTALNTIIDGITDIVSSFLDEKSALHQKFMEIMKKLHLTDLIKVILKAFIIGLTEAIEANVGIWESLTGELDALIEALWQAVKPLFDYIWKKIKAKLKTWLFGEEGSFLGLTFDFDPLTFLIGKPLFKGEGSLFDGLGEKLSDFWNNLPWNKNKKTKIPVEIDPAIGDDEGKLDLSKLVDKSDPIELEFEDAKLGKITATTIEVEIFKGKKLEVEEILAETLTLVDIFADKLHVGEIDSDMSGKKEMDKFYGANDNNANGGTLSKDKGDLYVENIFAELLDVKKILSELLEVGEKITTPLLEAEKITTALLEAKKITTKLLDAKKIVTKLLEAEKMWTKFLEVRDNILTQELNVEKKTTTKLFEIDRVSVKDNGLGNFTASIDNLDKLFVPLIEALKLAVEEIVANVMSLQTLKVTIFTAKSLDVDAIYAQTLNLGQIIANTLRVGSIVSGGGLGLTNIVDNGFNEHGGEYYIEKPQFAKDDRWSDISGLVPSAEDFLRGFDDVYKGVYDGVYDSFNKTIGTVTQPINLGDYSIGTTQGTVRNGNTVTDESDGITRVWTSNRFEAGGQSTTVGDMEIPAEAQYMKDVLTKAIGNEKGALGLLGNLYAESGLKSNNLQDTAGNLGVTQKDIDYTNAVNNGANFLDNKGYGIAQWTTSDRKKKLQDSLGGKSIDDLDGQLQYLIQELQTDFPNVWKQLQNAESIHDASTAVLRGFEKPKDQGYDQDALRWHYGETLGRTLDETEIPDEPVPTADTPQNNEPNLYDGFDEANVVDLSDNQGGGLSGTPFSFLETLPIQTEFIMARVYNIIDKWLGRIYRLFKSFNVDDFLKDLLELEEIEVNLKGKLDIFDDIEDLLKKLIDLIEKLLKDGIKYVNDGKDDVDKIDITIPDVEKQLNKIIKLLEKLSKDGIECHCDCKCGEGESPYEPIVRAMHDCGFPADDTHLRNNTDAKSKNTKAVESLNDAIGRNTDRLVGAVGDWINCAGDTGHLDNNTKAKSDNTRAVESLNKNMGSFISNLQGTLSNISCNCNCGGNCGNCAMGQSGNNGNNGYNPPNNNGYNPPNNGNGSGTYTPSTNNTGDRGGYNQPNGNSSDGGNYNPPDYYDGNGGGQPNGGVLNRNDGNNNGNNNNNNGNNNGDNNNGNNNGNNNQQKVDPNTGIPTDYAPTFNPATGLTMFADREGNYYPEYGQEKVKGFGDDPEAEWATGFFEADFNRRQEEKKKAEEAEKKRLEESKQKAEEAREKNNEQIPAVKPWVVDENGNLTTTSDKYKELFDSENKKVEEMRKKGKEYLDNVNKYGTEEQKKSAENYYNSLMTNKGSVDTSPYEFNLEKLEDLSSKAVTANALGSDYGDVRLGAGGGIHAVKDLIKSDAGKALLANALISDYDASGNEIYWFTKGNGSKNSAQAKDKITDPNVIADIKNNIKKLGVSEDMANFGKTHEFAYSLYKDILSSADSETKEKAKATFQRYLAWLHSSQPERAEVYLKRLREYAGDTNEGFMEQFKNAVDEGWEIVTAYGNSSSNSPFKDPSILEKIFSGKLDTWLGYAEPSGANITSKPRDLTTSDLKSLFDYWYKNRFLVKGYQMGGIPNVGELFVARENGTPEYVGSLGGKTAVANNDQIVTAVANGVSMANDRVVNAIESQTNALGNAIDRKDLNVQIGDRQIAEANKRGQKGMGNNFVE